MAETEETRVESAQDENPKTKYAQASVSSTSSPPSVNLALLSQEVISTITPAVKRKARIIAEKEVRKNLPRFIEVLGIFVGLFTFITIQVQIFSRITSLSNAIIFSFFIFLCMIGFLLMLHLVMTVTLQDNILKATILPFTALLVVVLVGFWSIFYLVKNDIPLNKQENNEIEMLKERIAKLEGQLAR